GASLGALVTPLIVLLFLQYTPSWRPPFVAVGAVGMFWVVLWLLTIRRNDLALPEAAKEAPSAIDDARLHSSLGGSLRGRRSYVLPVLVVTINAAWHFFRAWLPLFLKEGHGYTAESVQWFTMGYCLSADVGTLLAGYVTMGLAQRGLAVHRSRLVVWLFCA